MSLAGVSWPERAVFVVFCVALAASPLLAHLAIHALPGVAPDEPWYDRGIYVSWACLILFSWAWLPRLNLPAKERLGAWLLFIGLELAYPVASWLVEGGDRLHAFADVASCFSTSLALAAGCLLAWRGAAMLWQREFFILGPLAFVAFFVVWPGLSVEWDWWVAWELPHGGPLSQTLRALGVFAGTTGVLRNMLRSDVLR